MKKTRTYTFVCRDQFDNEQTESAHGFQYYDLYISPWCACMHHCTSLKGNFAVHSLMQCFHIFICAMFIELLYSCLIFLAGNHLSV